MMTRPIHIGTFRPHLSDIQETGNRPKILQTGYIELMAPRRAAEGLLK